MTAKAALYVSIMVGIAVISHGCERSGGGDPAVFRDSAGVMIVENERGIWPDGGGWDVEDTCAVDIGVFEGPAEYQLFRVNDARRLSDGRIVVANAGTYELRFYDADGTYLSASGRQGGGPGEFEGLGWIRPYPGDSLLAYDFNQIRVSVWDSEGEFGRSFRLNPPGDAGFVIGQGAFADGTLLVKAPLIFRGVLSDGLSRSDEEYQTYSTTGELIDTVGVFYGPDHFIKTGGDDTQRFVEVIPLPFGRSPVVAVFGDRFYFGSAESYEIECRSKDGTLERLIRRDQEPRPVTARDMARYVERRLAESEDEDAHRELRRTYEEMPSAETMPAYSELKVDDLGNLWVRDFDPDEGSVSSWAVFDADGRLLGSLDLPSGLRPAHIGPDFVLGIWRDEMDVEHVRLHQLIKP